MKIIDNFLTNKYHEEILELLSGSQFEWYYEYNISGYKRSPLDTHLNEYGFSHIFWNGQFGENNSQYSLFIKPMLYQIMDAANCDYILRARADMVTWTGKEDFIHHAHSDYDVPNIASVFYVNETDGDTIFYNVKPGDVPKDKELKEYDRVSPKPNRLVIFDGELLHTGSSPTKHKNRILINSNYGKVT